MFFSSQKKQREVFAEAILDHADTLYGTALRLTGRVADAEDLVQDTCVRALSFQSRFDPGTNLRAWLFKMMINLFINKYKRSRRLREIQSGPESNDLTERLNPNDQLTGTIEPEEFFFERLLSDDVVRALEDLPLDFKMVVLLSDINGFSYNQISEILGIPVGTVMSRLHRGRRLLRAALYDFAVAEGYVRPTAGAKPDSDKKENSGGETPVVLEDYRKRKEGHSS